MLHPDFRNKYKDQGCLSLFEFAKFLRLEGTPLLYIHIFIIQNA